MPPKPGTEYLKTQIMTASPEMLQLMLWDGAIRFAEQGKEAIAKKDIEGSYRLLVRAQKIVMEMNASLRHDVNPELCKNLAALYNFIYRRLVDGNVRKDAVPVNEALGLMRHQRETWVMLMEKLVQERTATMHENITAVSAPIDQSELRSAAPQPAAPAGRARYPGSRPMAVPATTLSVQG